MAGDSHPFQSYTKIRDIINDFGDNTTAHGIPRIITAKNLLSRLFWICICLCAFSFFIVQSVELLKDYFNYPTSTKVELIPKSEVQFPSVTVCNMNRFRKSALIGTRFEELIEIDGGFDDDDDPRDSSGSGDLLGVNSTGSGEEDTNDIDEGFLVEVRRDTSYRDSQLLDGYDWYDYESLDFEYDNYYNWKNIEGPNDWKGIYNNSVSEEYTDIIKALNPTKEELMEYGHQAEDFILQCTFDKRKCNYTDFRQFQNIDFGNCYTFNHGTGGDVLRKTSQTGAQFGLHLTLFIEEAEYIGLLSHDVGIRVTVHPPTISPHPEDTGIAAETGKSTSISLRQTDISRASGKYGNCSDEIPRERNINSSFYHHDYLYLSCQKLCLQEQLYEKCGCVSDIYIEGPKCDFLNTTQQACQQVTETLAITGKLDCKCHLRCKETSYKTSISTSLWPSERYLKHMYKKVSQRSSKAAGILGSLEKSRKNLVRLKVFFQELNFESIYEVPVYSTASQYWLSWWTSWIVYRPVDYYYGGINYICL